MALWRWLRAPELGFPQPRYINKRRYFDLAELDAWDAQRAASAEA